MSGNGGLRRAADMILQGIFADQTYEEVLEEFKNKWYIVDWRKRQEAAAAELLSPVQETESVEEE